MKALSAHSSTSPTSPAAAGSLRPWSTCPSSRARTRPAAPTVCAARTPYRRAERPATGSRPVGRGQRLVIGSGFSLAPSSSVNLHQLQTGCVVPASRLDASQRAPHRLSDASPLFDLNRNATHDAFFSGERQHITQQTTQRTTEHKSCGLLWSLLHCRAHSRTEENNIRKTCSRIECIEYNASSQRVIPSGLKHTRLASWINHSIYTSPTLLR